MKHYLSTSDERKIIEKFQTTHQFRRYEPDARKGRIRRWDSQRYRVFRYCACSHYETVLLHSLSFCYCFFHTFLAPPCISISMNSSDWFRSLLSFSLPLYLSARGSHREFLFISFLQYLKKSTSPQALNQTKFPLPLTTSRGFWSLLRISSKSHRRCCDVPLTFLSY